MKHNQMFLCKPVLAVIAWEVSVEVSYNYVVYFNAGCFLTSL